MSRAAISYGGANALGKRFRMLGIPPVMGAFGQMSATAIMVFPLMVAIDRPWTEGGPTADVWLAMAGLIVLSTALGYVVFFRILASAGAINISLVTLLIPVTALLLGSLVLGEHVSSMQLVGMLLIGLGLVTIDGRAIGWFVSRRRAIARGPVRGQS